MAFTACAEAMHCVRRKCNLYRGRSVMLCAVEQPLCLQPVLRKRLCSRQASCHSAHHCLPCTCGAKISVTFSSTFIISGSSWYLVMFWRWWQQQ